jgi:DNA modification methylase
VTPYYEDELVIIYHGDCVDILSDPAVHADFAITDPPYNYGKRYGVHYDSMIPAAYAAWTDLWVRELRAASKSQVVFPGVGNLEMWMRLFPTKTVACWFKPGNPKGGGPFNFYEWEPVLFYNAGWIGGSDVFRATVSEQQGTGDHPCPKPLSLMRALVSRTKAPTVVDPFMGSGTTLRAAKDLGRKAIGIEIEERYCEIAAKRMGQEVLDFAQ